MAIDEDWIYSCEEAVFEKFGLNSIPAYYDTTEMEEWLYDFIKKSAAYDYLTERDVYLAEDINCHITASVINRIIKERR